MHTTRNLVSSLSRFYTCLLAIGWLACPLLAQDTVSYSLASPRDAVVTHLKNLQVDTYHPQVAAKVFEDTGISTAQASRYARMLKQIWDGEGIFIAVSEIPNNPQYVDSVTNKARYVVVDRYPDIYLVKQGQRWVYGERALAEISRVHQSLYPFGADFLVNLFPESSHRRFLGLQLWQYLGLVLLLAIGWAVYRIFLWIFNRILVSVAHKMGYKDVVSTFVQPVAKPFSLVVVSFFFLMVLPWLQLPIAWSKYAVIAIKTALPIFAVLVFYYLVDVMSLYLERLSKRTASTMDDQLIPIVRRSLKIFVVAIGILFVLHNWDVNITALLAGLSIGGLALALAAQETLKNFFGSIMIFLDRPFQIGDWISGDGIDGTVEEVGFRSTRVRTFRNSLVTIPNGRLADLTIDNHGLRRYRRFNTHFTITYDTPVPLIELFVEALKKLVEDHPQTRKDYYEVHMHQMDNSSLNILFYIFFEVADWSAELKARHDILLKVLELAENLGVRFAFPTQTLHMETFPGQPSLTPSVPDDMDTLRKKLNAYFDQNKSQD